MSSNGRTREPDWDAIEASPAFRDLVASRGRFVTAAVVLSLAWFGAFILLVGYAEALLRRSIAGGFTVAYALGLSQFLMVWIVTWLYLRRSGRVFGPLERRVVEEASRAASAPAACELEAAR
jgi:uncharacterized membrane protein (DUF485 family)